MRNKRYLALIMSLCLAVGSLSGCASRAKVTEDMIPTVIDLRQGADETIAETAEVLGLSMNTSYLSELMRLDGDNTEAAPVAAKDIQVVLKATSVEKDLKIKFVNEKNGRVITGTAFKVDVTDADKKTKEYTDEDKDGIIHIQNIAGGSYKIEMKDAAGYQGGQSITATVKDKIEYKAVDVTDEVKKEGEVNVAGEDGAYGGKNTDASTSNPGAALTDTVEYVESTKTPIYEEGEKKQKVDSFGHLVYSEQKLDEFGTPMYEKILSEPDSYHTFVNGTCTRCGKQQHEHSYTEQIVTEATCTTEGQKVLTCSCGDKKAESIPALGHVDNDKNGICDRENCNSAISATPASLANAGSVMVGLAVQHVNLVKTASTEKIVYDTSSAPIYNTKSAPVYEEAKITGYKYTGWQTLDDGTYYFDKNGKYVTGTQVIQGVQYTFDSKGRRSSVIGIDVSKYQSSIDWKKVKSAGIDFVYVRCGYRGYGTGVLVEDPMFRSHISGAKAAGLKVGVYFFSQAVTEAEAVEEASMAISLVKAVGGINLPIAIDSEYAAGGAGRADGLSKTARTTVTRAFCNTVANSGYTPMVYASKSWFSDHLNVGSLGGYRIWVAHYASKCGYTGTHHVWQYTSTGKVSGVSGNVDMNISYI